MTTPQLKLPHLTVRQVFQGTLLVLAVAAVFYFFFRFHQVFLTMFVAIVIGTATRPVVQFLNHRGIPKEIGIILIYLFILILIVTGILLLAPMVGQQVDLIIDIIPGTYNQIREGMLGNPNFFVWRIATEMPETFTLSQPPPPPADEEAEAEEVFQNFANSLRLLGLGAKTVFILFAALVLAFYWTLDAQRNRTALKLVIPPEHRQKISEFAAEAESRFGAFVRGQTLLGLIIGSLSFVAYLIIGLPYALALAIIAGIMETVPVIGPILGAVPALIVAYTVDPSKGLWVFVATVIIQQLENNFLVPRVMKRAVGVNPLVTLLALTAFGSLFGLLGAVVAIPLAAIIQLTLDRFVISSAVPDEKEITGRDKASLIRYETQELIKDIRTSVRRKEAESDEETDQVEDSIEAIAIDLNNALSMPAVRNPKIRRRLPSDD